MLDIAKDMNVACLNDFVEREKVEGHGRDIENLYEKKVSRACG